MGILSLSSMSYLQLTRSLRIAIQFGEILIYIDTVSIGSRHIWPFSRPFVVLSRPFLVLSQPFPVFSRPFPHHVPPQNLSCPQLMPRGGGRGAGLNYPYRPCASIAATAAIATISSTSSPACKTCTGAPIPSRIGPIASAFVKRDSSL